jgi:predicted nucleic acid-binding protein
VVAPDALHVRLPICTDKDDQKFLEIARDSGATVLITKDKALLKLARKTAAMGLFAIMLPEAWLKAAASLAPAAALE